MKTNDHAYLKESLILQYWDFVIYSKETEKRSFGKINHVERGEKSTSKVNTSLTGIK